VGDITVQITYSARRKKTIGARIINWTTLAVAAPVGIPSAELRKAIDGFVDKLRQDRQTARRFASDDALEQRAQRLNRDYFGGKLRWRSIRFVSNQNRRVGSCSPARGTIRISERLSSTPDFVLDYVIVHELAHLLVANHSPAFWKHVNRYPRTERARGFLMGMQLEREDADSDDLEDETTPEEE
jgi:predicted metal-dependent hydrolase